MDYATGDFPFSVAIDDLDGDGNSDLAAANVNTSTISVLLGHGDGTFGTKVDYLAGTRSVAIGDLNGDGKPDLVTSDPPRGGVSVLRNIAPRAPRLQISVDFEPNVINLRGRSPWIRASIEPAGFDPAKIDQSTLRLAGSVPATPNFAILGDHNTNGIADLMVKFSRVPLDPLLTPGVNELGVTGSLVTGELFEGRGKVRVIDPHRAPVSASVAPNPLNPSGVLTLNTSVPGPVTVKVFDLQGRLVRILIEAAVLPAGVHELRIDGRAGSGQTLASGIYFYRVESAEGAVTGRIAILR